MPSNKTNEVEHQEVDYLEKKKPNTIETVNVIEYKHGEILNLWSFLDNAGQGIDEAEYVFKQWCIDRMFGEKETKEMLDDGMAKHKNGKIVIFQSNK